MLSVPTNVDWPISFHHSFSNVTTAIKIFVGKWASGSSVKGFISNWKGNLHRRWFFHRSFRQPCAKRKHSQSAMLWIRKAPVICWFCFCCHTSCVGLRKEEGPDGQRGASLFLSALAPASASMGRSWIHSLSKYLTVWAVRRGKNQALQKVE